MKRILIINSDPDTMQLLHDLLELKGFHIKYTATKSAVPELLESFNPDLVLLDITQTAVMESFHSQAAHIRIPVLLMTGHNNYPDVQESNFKYFICKPFVMEELMKHINGIFKRA